MLVSSGPVPELHQHAAPTVRNPMNSLEDRKKGCRSCPTRKGANRATLLVFIGAGEPGEMAPRWQIGQIGAKPKLFEGMKRFRGLWG